jgi:hypothetical protein
MAIAVGAAAAATLGIALFVYWLITALSGRRHALHHIGRLAAEIIAVAQTIESDLACKPAAACAPLFRSRCLERRRRADEAVEARQELDRLSLQDMEAWLERLHEDHGGIVHLRSELGAELAAVVRGVQPRVEAAERSPSQWPGSGYQTAT